MHGMPTSNVVQDKKIFGDDEMDATFTYKPIYYELEL